MAIADMSLTPKRQKFPENTRTLIDSDTSQHPGGEILLAAGSGPARGTKGPLTRKLGEWAWWVGCGVRFGVACWGCFGDGDVVAEGFELADGTGPGLGRVTPGEVVGA